LNNQTAYITGHCVIRQQRVYCNGQLLWQDESAASLQEFLRNGYDRFAGQYPKFHKMDNLCKLGWLAAEVLLQAAPAVDHLPEQVALVLSNRSASLDTDVRYYQSVKDIPSPALFVYTLPNIVIGEICIRHGFKGEHAFFVNNRFDAAQVFACAALLLGSGAATACICGWLEVMDQQYEAVLYMVERKDVEGALPFTADNLQKIFES
jgi:3-oxoacyl-(acyl-carrier-protein) synthase